MRRWIELKHHWDVKGKNNDLTEVSLPHTWNACDGQDGGDDYYRGTYFYHAHFEKPSFLENECVYLQFEGVNASANVILNGVKIMVHHGGYSTFRREITSLLKEENDLLVEVDNSVNKSVYPQRADFTFYGGIYRPVRLIILNRNHFDMDYFGSDGFFYTCRIAKGKAFVDVKAFNGTAGKVISKLFDADDRLIDEKEGNPSTLCVESPHLWNGTRDPYLYKLVIQLLVDETVCDEVSCRVGIREISVDPKKGFMLNGKSYPLHGVSRHQDRKGIGNAIEFVHMKEDMELIKEIGANTIRLAHYQHAQEFYDLCDEEGMIVWAEIPYISEHLPEGNENTITQMTELIVQNHRHPSIVTWGISNEITISVRDKKGMMENHRALQALCHRLDPSRPTTMACYACLSMFHPISKITDLVGWNLYLGWYVPGFFLNDLFIRAYHLFHPRRALCYSEYGAEGMPNLHSKHPHRGDHSEEYQAKYHEYMVRCFARYPYLWATYVWNMFDFAADARNQGGEPGMNHKGLVTFDRKIKKDSFYLYKAYWSDAPFVHICGKRYTNRSGRKLHLKIYTNQSQIRVLQNGEESLTLSGNKVFKVTLHMKDENEIVVSAGTCEDRIMIRRVPKEDPDYKLKKTHSGNWV